MLSLCVKRMTLFFVQKGIFPEEDREVYAYGFELLLSTIFSLLTVFVMSVFFGRITETLVFILTFIVMRIFAGGYHASNHLRCFLALISIYSLFLIILTFCGGRTILWLSGGFAVISLATVFLLSPVADKNKPLTEKETKTFRLRSRVVTVFCVMVIACGIAFLKGNFLVLSVSCGLFAVAASLTAAKIRNFFSGRDAR